jgi:hypothetical protein
VPEDTAAAEKEVDEQDEAQQMDVDAPQPPAEERPAATSGGSRLNARTDGE